MKTATPKKPGRTPKASFWPDGRKLTLSLRPEELIIGKDLCRRLAMPGQRLTVQDVCRMGLMKLDATTSKVAPKASAKSPSPGKTP